MRPLVTMRAALSDPNLLGGALPGDSWKPWRVLLIAVLGEALTDDERVLFEQLTGRTREPGEIVHEFWAVVGRRGGKTRAGGTIAAYLSCLVDWADVLAPGERAVLPILAASTVQATRCFQAAQGVLTTSPVLKGMIETENADEIKLTTRVDIQIRPANFKTIRGITAIGAIGDEVAFWSVGDSANPDREILDALRPALATTGGPLVVISSPYAKRGELYGAFRAHFGPDGDPRVLVAKGPSRVFNYTLPQAVIDRAYAKDSAVASAEYGGEFRGDIEQFVSREIIESAIERGVIERAPIDHVKYFGFVDPSGGSSDAMTLAIAHSEAGCLILDAIRERKPPFAPSAVVADFCDLLKRYRIGTVRGDRYAGEWPREQFALNGITYHCSDLNRSELYLAVLPEFNSGSVSLVDEPRIITQFAGLERRTSRGGRDLIDHATGQHDDLANAIAGALIAAKPSAQIIPIVAPYVVSTPRGFGATNPALSNFPWSR